MLHMQKIKSSTIKIDNSYMVFPLYYLKIKHLIL